MSGCSHLAVLRYDLAEYHWHVILLSISSDQAGNRAFLCLPFTAGASVFPLGGFGVDYIRGPLTHESIKWFLILLLGYEVQLSPKRGLSTFINDYSTVRVLVCGDATRLKIIVGYDVVARHRFRFYNLVKVL